MAPSHKAPTWLRLSEAAAYLGVHPATVRRWADEGQIACIRTPGGRRRFTQGDLDAFMAAMRSEASPTDAHAMVLLPGSPMVFTSQHTSIQDQDWYGHMDESHRSMLRGQGQRLMATLIHYISRHEGGDAYLQEGERLAAGYAGLFLKNGLGLTDVINAFLMVRRSITSSLLEARHGEGTLDDAASRLHDRTEDFLDRVLMTMVDVYQNPETECMPK
jgi:excisionase family DNA binding protein